MSILQPAQTVRNPPDDQDQPAHAPLSETRKAPSLVEAVSTYLKRGITVIPQRPGTKQPCVQWKAFQERQPSGTEVAEWDRRYPDAGLAAVLGPMSNLFVIDVDGEDAHRVLLERLGSEPNTPKVYSGSGDPFRYHLFFRHPPIPTKGSITPWHPKLELRGTNVLVVLPPSIHKSGKPYVWAPDRSLDDVPLMELPPAVLEALKEHNQRVAEAKQQAVPELRAEDLPEIERRARAYLNKLPPAIEGRGGDKQTFAAACCLVQGFALSVEQALPLLLEYNQRCAPPWAETDLLHKLKEAVKAPGTRGHLLRTSTATIVAPQEAKPQSGIASVYHGIVPDFVQADRWRASPGPGSMGISKWPSQMCFGLLWLLHQAVVVQKRGQVVIPDIVMSETIWGANFGRRRNWRTLLGRAVKDVFPLGTSVELLEGDICPDNCILKGDRAKHRHYKISIPTPDPDGLLDPSEAGDWFMGCLEVFGYDGTGAKRLYHWRGDPGATRPADDPLSPEDQAEQKKRVATAQTLKRKGRFMAAYLPALLFGMSPCLKLPFGQFQILRALTTETTRSKKKTERPDKAQLVFAEGSKTASNDQDTVVGFDGLQADIAYVGFNGNGAKSRARFHGNGYRLGHWLGLVGYPDAESDEQFAKYAAKFLKDLEGLSKVFGLTIGAFNKSTKQWVSLPALAKLLRTQSRTRADAYMLRIYTPADYLERWRKLFAERLGFSLIPSAEQPPAVGQSPAESAEGLLTFLEANKITQATLAKELGMSKGLVSGRLSGKRPWTAKWKLQIEEWLRARATTTKP